MAEQLSNVDCLTDIWPVLLYRVVNFPEINISENFPEISGNISQSLKVITCIIFIRIC